jgi:hypothetical protein
VNMRALSPLPHDVHVDLDALTFLLEMDHRQILGELMAADECFHAAIQAVNERSIFHRETVQPILRAAGAPEGTETTPAEVESILGHTVYMELLRATDQAISLVDRTLVSTQAIAGQLRDVLLKV